jgi:hypothetical protein
VQCVISAKCELKSERTRNTMQELNPQPVFFGAPGQIAPRKADFVIVDWLEFQLSEVGTGLDVA